MEAFEAKRLPLRKEDLDPSVYVEALIDATARLEVYKTKLASSKLDQNWFLPTLQQREAWASSLMEGTQATLCLLYTSERVLYFAAHRRFAVFNITLPVNRVVADLGKAAGAAVNTEINF